MRVNCPSAKIPCCASNQPKRPRLTPNWTYLAALLAFATPAFATSSNWISPTSSTSLTPANWSTNPVVPNAIDDSATLGSSTANQTVTLNSPITLGNLTFDSPFAYTLAPGTGNLTLQTSSGNASLTITSALNNANDLISAPINFASPTTITNNATAGNLALTGALTGSSDITFNGPSLILLSGNSANWTSNLFINAANVTTFTSTALGTGNATINTGATLNLSNTTAKNFILNGGTLHSTIAITLNNTTLSADSSITGTNFTLNTLIGAANLFLTTTNLTLSGNSPTFTGNIAIASGGVVQLTGGLANATQFSLAAGSTLIVTRPAGTDATLNSLAPGALLTNGGYLGIATDIDFRPLLAPTSTLAGILINTANATLGGSNSLDLNAFSNPTTLRIAGNGSLASTLDIRPDLTTHTIRFGLANNISNLTINATLTDHDSASANLDINGGTTILASANTYSGTTTIANGTLQINNANALGSASGTDADATIINANGTLKLGAGLTLANEKITVNPNATLTAADSTTIFNNPITINGGTLGNGTFNNNLNVLSNYSISGTATLGGNNSYTAVTTITAGNVTIANSNALGSAVGGTIVKGTLNVNVSTAEPFTVSGGLLNLNAAQSGLITISSGNISLNAVSSSTISAGGGITRLNVPTNDPLVIHGGDVGLIANGLYGGSVTMGGGISWIFGTGNATLTQTINITGDSYIAASNATLSSGIAGAGNFFAGMPGSSGYILTINGPITSSGTFHASSGPVTINSANSFAASVIIDGGNAIFNAPNTFNPFTISSGTASFNSPNQFNQALNITGGTATFSGGQTFSGGINMTAGSAVLQGTNSVNGPWNIDGTIIVNADNTVSSLRLNGTLTIAAGATLTLQTPTLNLQGGTLNLNGSLAGIASIVKTTSGSATITGSGNLPASITIQQGILNAYGSSSSASFTVASSANATLDAGGTFSSAIFLQNANGANGTGGLVLGTNAVILGTINAGTDSSTIGLDSQNRGGEIAGPVTGNAVVFNPAGFGIQLTSANSTYTGSTTINAGSLELFNSGQLLSTSVINLHNGGELRLDNSGTVSLPDRLNDAIPVIGNGGMLSLYGSQSDAIPSTETVGDFIANTGLSTIAVGSDLVSISNNYQVDLTVNSIHRNPGATLQFSFGTSPYYVSGTGLKIFIHNVPALHNGIIGGWAIVNDNTTFSSTYSFATYGPSGISQLTAFNTDINTGTSQVNVSLSNSTNLLSSKTINSLQLLSGTLDLGGNALTIDTGGIILSSNTLIQDGSLIGGAFSNGELFVFLSGAISANIVDTPGRATSLTVAAGLKLSGTNTYTGPTVVERYQLIVNNASAVAPGDLSLIYGRYAIGFNNLATNPINIGNFLMSGSSSQFGVISGSAYFDALSWTLNGGQMGVHMVGNGPTTINAYQLLGASNLDTYQGNITINGGGTLEFGGTMLGTGSVIVNANGTLYVTGQSSSGNVILNGGTLQSNDLSASSTNTFTGNTSVVASSTFSNVLANQTVNLVPHNQLTVESYVDLKGGISDGANATSSTRGSIVVAQGATLNAGAVSVGSLTVNGNMAFHTNATNTGTSDVASLAIAGMTGGWTSGLNIANTKFIIQPLTAKSAALSTLQDQITFGHSHSAGIFSSSLTGNQTVVVADNAFLHLSTFGGIPNLDDNSLLITVALPGDANVDGSVDINDLAILSTDWQLPAINWAQGDFNGDGIVNLTDATLLSQNWPGGPNTPSFQAALAQFPNLASVPEPTSLSLLALAAPLFLRRRKYTKRLP